LLQQQKLIISVSTGQYRKKEDANLNSASAIEYAKSRRKILLRDQYTCQYCGFKSVADRKAPATSVLASGYLELHHLDGNHGHNSKENQITICPFCHMVFHVGYNGHQDRCTLIFFPWLPQEQLNILVMCLGVAISRKKDKLGRKAANLLAFLESYRSELIKQYGPDMADPIQLAWVLKKAAAKNKKIYENRGKVLSDFRVLPNINKFKDPIRYWSNTGWMRGKNWETLWEKTFQQWLQHNQSKISN
jgi:intracellular multiplication protein IcmJ